MLENLSLREQLEETQEELRQLRQLFLPTTNFPISWKLTPAETRLLGALYAYTSGAPLPQEALHRAITNNLETHPKMVDVRICTVRKKIAPYGIVIATAYGRGHYLTPESRVIIKRTLAQQLDELQAA